MKKQLIPLRRESWRSAAAAGAAPAARSQRQPDVPSITSHPRHAAAQGRRGGVAEPRASREPRAVSSAQPQRLCRLRRETKHLGEQRGSDTWPRSCARGRRRLPLLALISPGVPGRAGGSMARWPPSTSSLRGSAAAFWTGDGASCALVPERFSRSNEEGD